MERLRLKNFKCFRDQTISLNQLTVLTGTNNSGKTSVIQGLLILHASIHNKGIVDLNNSLGVQLGFDHSVLNRNAQEPNIGIEYKSEKNDGFRVQRAVVGDQSLCYLKFEDVTSGYVSGLSLSSPELYYLCAERLGPRLTRQFGVLGYKNVGVRGEHTAQILNEYGLTSMVDAERCVPGTPNQSLMAQTNYWLSAIMPEYRVSRIEQLGLHTLMHVQSAGHSKEMLATNVGYGFSYLLPIIVSGLIAERGRYLIIENPGAHLHSASQVALARFIVRMAMAGVRIVIETLGDSLMEGMQHEIAEHPDFCSNVTINYFEPGSNGEPRVHEIQFSSYANMSQHPMGIGLYAPRP